MTFINAYITGFKTIFQKKRLWLLLYGLNFLFALFLAYPLAGFLEDKLGNTLAADKLLDGFDFTIANDFMNEHGDLFAILWNQSIIAFILYFLLSVFFVGGILAVLKNKTLSAQLSTFWQGAASYFWRMLRLSIYFLVIQGILFFAFFMLFSFLTTGGLERFPNEAAIFKRGMILLPFYLFSATIVFMIQDYAKIHIVNMDKKLIFQPVLQAFRWVFKNFFQSFSLYLLNLITFGILFFIYWNIDKGNLILFTFLMGQLFVVVRIGTKLLNLASAMELYQQRN